MAGRSSSNSAITARKRRRRRARFRQRCAALGIDSRGRQRPIGFAPTRRTVEQLQVSDEALYVIADALFRASRGRRGHHPAAQFSGTRKRDPRENLRIALESKGFNSLSEAAQWFGEQRIAHRHQEVHLESHTRPPANVEGMTWERHNVALKIESPSRLSTYLKRLGDGDLAESKPIIVDVRDADGCRLKLVIDIRLDPWPEDKGRLLVAGRVRLRRGIKVRTLDGRLRGLFPEQLVRLRIDPGERVYALEFSDGALG